MEAKDIVKDKAELETNLIKFLDEAVFPKLHELSKESVSIYEKEHPKEGKADGYHVKLELYNLDFDNPPSISENDSESDVSNIKVEIHPAFRKPKTDEPTVDESE